MKNHGVFDVFRDVVYGCPSYKILTKVRIGKDCIFRGYRSPSGPRVSQHACTGARKAPRRMTESTLSSVIEVAFDAARLMFERSE